MVRGPFDATVETWREAGTDENVVVVGPEREGSALDPGAVGVEFE